MVAYRPILVAVALAFTAAGTALPAASASAAEGGGSAVSPIGPPPMPSKVASPYFMKVIKADYDCVQYLPDPTTPCGLLPTLYNKLGLGIYWTPCSDPVCFRRASTLIVYKVPPPPPPPWADCPPGSPQPCPVPEHASMGVARQAAPSTSGSESAALGASSLAPAMSTFPVTPPGYVVLREIAVPAGSFYQLVVVPLKLGDCFAIRAFSAPPNVVASGETGQHCVNANDVYGLLSGH